VRRPDGSFVAAGDDADGVWRAVRTDGAWTGSRIDDYPYSEGADLAVNAAGTVEATWYLYRDTGGNANPEYAHVRAARLVPGDTRFGAPVDVTPPVEGTFDRSPEVGLADDGTATVAFERGDFDARTVQAATLGPDGRVAVAAALLSTARGAQAPVVAPYLGGATVAWSQRNADDRFEVVATERAADGTAATAETLSRTDGMAYAPELASGPDGSAMLHWETVGATPETATVQTLRRLPHATRFTQFDEVPAPGIWDHWVAVSRGGAALLGMRLKRDDGVELRSADMAGEEPPAHCAASCDLPPECRDTTRPIADCDHFKPPYPGPTPPGDRVGPPARAVAGSVFTSWRAGRRSTRVRRLRVLAAPGATVRVSCAGKGCPKRLASTTRTTAGGWVRPRRLQGARLPAGVRLTVRVTAPGRDAVRITWRMRKGKAPTVVR
jgi:hypothetical protein